MRTAINIVAFQASWLACVVGAAKGASWIGVGVATGSVLLHVASAEAPRAEVALVLAAIGLGAAFDTVLAATGWVQYAGETLHAGLAPFWILALWGAFATTLDSSLGWLRPHPVWAALLGATLGPASYVAAERLGAVALEPAAVAALALGWGVVAPLLLRLAGPANAEASRQAANEHST